MSISIDEFTSTITDRTDILKIEEIPYSERGVPETTFEIFKNSAEKFGQRTALTFLKNGVVTDDALNISYRELLFNIIQTANLFHGYNVGHKGVVSLLLPNVPEMHYALWGAQVSGIGNPVNPFLEADTICDILTAAGSQALVTLGPSEDRDVWQKVLSIADRVPTLRYIFVVSSNGQEMKETPGGVQILDFNISRRQQDGAELKSNRVSKADDVSAYFHTGGTTGTPKLASHSHANQTFIAYIFCHIVKLTQDDCAMGGLPLFHVNAVYSAGLSNFIVGARVIMLGPDGFRNKASVGDFWKIVAKYRASWVSGVPTFYGALLSVPVGDQDISSLRLGVVGAAPASPELFRQFEVFQDLRLVEGYGLTEGTCVSSINPANGPLRVGSIGLRLPYQEMKAVELDDEGRIVRECDTEEGGVLVIRGPNVFQGYLQKEANKGVLLEDGWLNTGDLGKCDAEGFFWLTGRAKDLIIRGGHNIDPKMIEDVLAQHPAVALVAAIGQPDPYAGELPAAYVTLKENMTATDEELIGFCRKNIGERAAIPVHVEILDQMPLTAVGKIFKPELRRRAIGRILEAAFEKAGLVAGVTVINDVKSGLLVKVAASTDQKKIQQILNQFTVKSLVE